MNSLRSFWSSLPGAARLTVVGLPALFLVLLLVVVFVVGQPAPRPVATNLSAVNAAAATTALTTAGIRYTFNNDGTAVLVSETDYAAAKVALGTAGISTTGQAATSGFELFNNTPFGASAFDQQVTYQRAIEGELTRTIDGMRGVKSARVAITPAQKGLFSTQDRAATASIVLEMIGAVRPDNALVAAVKATAAGAVADLAVTAVTVVDANGAVLDGKGDGFAAGLAQAQSGLEASFTNKIQGLVDQAVGPGHASVAISVELDTQALTRETTTYTPVDTAHYTPVSVRQILEQYGLGGSTSVAGIPGSQSNVPGLPTYPLASPGPAASAAPAGPYSKNDVTVNYNLSQVIEKIASDPGSSIKRLGVAVLIDQNNSAGLDLAALRTSVAAAVSASAARGDQITVQAVPFAGNRPSVLGPSGDTMLATYLPIVATALLSLFLLLLVARNLRSLRLRADEALLLSAGIAQAAANAPLNPTEAQALDGAALQTFAMVDDLSANAAAQVAEKVRRIAEDQPEDVLALIQGWLREEPR